LASASESVPYTDIEEGEPADDLGDGLPDAVAGIVQVFDGHRDERKLTGDTETFDKKGIDDILIGLCGSRVAPMKLIFYLGQCQHTDQSLK